jgi:hypothetical protein
MDADLKSCFVFFTKGRPPIRVQAPDQLKACEKFYAQNPDFKLNELLDIKEARIKTPSSEWFLDNKIVKW